MTNQKKNRSFILQSIISKNGSWNSDFNHSPKQYEGHFFASDRALKYSVRNLMEQMGKEVFIKKWVKNFVPGKKTSDSSTVEVMPAKELKDYIKEKYGSEFAHVFWNFEDVRQFGMVYDNLALHGVVQISQGLDLYGQGVVYTDDLTGRMVFETKDKSKETRGMTTREHLTEAHFVYDISVNPKNVAFLQEIVGFEEFYYTKEDYELLLECLENGPRNVVSTQKTNCYTGFMLRVEMMDENPTLLSNLQGKISISPQKTDGKLEYDLTVLFEYLKNKQQKSDTPLFKNIHVMYESSDITVKGINTTLTEVTEKIL